MLQDLINGAAYMAHGYCLLWKPWLIALHAVSDVLIFASYFAIPSAIWIFLRKRTDLSAELKPLAVLFAGFIFLCGLTHAVQLITLWWPVYETQGYVKAATAIVSVTTAITIFPLIPKAIAIPSPGQLQLANNGLALEIAAHRETLAALEKAKDELEMRVAERTRDLEHSKARFEALVKASAQIVWTCNAEGQVEEDSPSWRAFTGLNYEAMKGEGWLEAVHPGDRTRIAAAWQKAIRTLQTYSAELRLRHLSAWRWTAAKAVPLANANGGVREWVGMNVDIDDRKCSEAALRASEERFRGIFEYAGTGITIGDMEGRFLSGNPAFCSMLGYTEEELRKLTIRDLVHPEDLDACMMNFHRLVAQEIPSFETLNRYVAKDGKPVWIHKHVSLLRDARGKPINAMALVTDMTERKRQEDHIRLLMREVNHRSKNMLSLVQAIARQTLTANPDDFLDRFGKRVEALAVNQDLLVKNAWKGAGLKELVRSQLGPFDDLIGMRITLQGPPLFISASAAQTIGMALHELATNAGKYGALSGAEGRVEIAWCIQRNERGEETFTISWRERCANSITAPAKKGFGSFVISTMAELSLGAQIELEFFATGLSWRLGCVASEVLEGPLGAVPIAESAQQAGNPAPAIERPRILVVEDEALVAIEIAHALAEAGFDVLGPVRDVRAALELLKRSSCAAAVLDINLGRETSEAIAAELTAMKTPFVTLSGYSSEQQYPAFAGAPALRKPFRLPLLVAELSKCIEHSDNGAMEQSQGFAH